MVHPRGARVRVNPVTNSRAVVREAEWKVMPERIASELKPLVKLAKDQGWTVAGTDSGKLVWRGPNGEGPVYTGYRCPGRELLNYRAELVRAGLRLDEKAAVDHVQETQVVRILDRAEGTTLDQIKDALDIINGGLAVLVVKAEEFNKVQQDAKEWEDLATEAQSAAERAIRRDENTQLLLDEIREAFKLAPWAILPEIARIVGVANGGPQKPPSLAEQATGERR